MAVHAHGEVRTCSGSTASEPHSRQQRPGVSLVLGAVLTARPSAASFPASKKTKVGARVPPKLAGSWLDYRSTFRKEASPASGKGGRRPLALALAVRPSLRGLGLGRSVHVRCNVLLAQIVEAQALASPHWG